MARSRRRGTHAEQHSNHERWLITYADMITLLMVLFIVLFAVSQVDQKRFEELKEGMAAGFGQESTPLQGEGRLMPEDGMKPIDPIQAMQVDDVEPATLPGGTGSGVAAPERQDVDEYAQARAEVERLDEIRRRLDRALRARGLRDEVRMAIGPRGLTVSLVSRHIVFDANLADLTPLGVRVLDAIGPVLRDVPDRLDIDGHTNQVKVKPKYYASDWDLSAARAITVLRYLEEKGGIDGQRLSAVAFGHEKPLIDPNRPGSQRLNKRVDIVVVSPASEATRELFDEVLREKPL